MLKRPASLIASVLALAAMLVLTTSVALAATTTLGSTTGTPNSNGCLAAAWMQSGSGAGTPPYAAPSAGIITSWSYGAGTITGSIKLKILRPTATAGQFLVVSETAASTIIVSTLNTVSANVPVQAGDIIALQIASGTPSCFHNDGTSGDSVALSAGDGAPGTTSTFGLCPGNCLTNPRLDLSAVLSPLRTTSTSVGCSPSPVSVGSATRCTAAVADTDTGTKVTPTGTIAFSSDSTGAFGSGGTCTLAAASPGSATCQVTYTPGAVGSGTHNVTGTYSGDGMHAASSGVAAVTVTAAPTLPRAGGHGPGPNPGLAAAILVVLAATTPLGWRLARRLR